MVLQVKDILEGNLHHCKFTCFSIPFVKINKCVLIPKTDIHV